MKLEKALDLYPNYDQADGPLPMIAAAHRELGEIAEEKTALDKFVALNDDTIDARLRLMELAATGATSPDKKTPDWKELQKQAEQALAIEPMRPATHRYLAQAAEALDERPLAIEAYKTLLQLNPLDRVDLHYRLAKLLFAEKDFLAARRQVDMALEEAPRYREGHALLLQIAGAMEH